MRHLLLGVLVGMVLMAPWANAFRIPSPPTIIEWNASSIAQLNTYLHSLWQLTNGRYTVDVTTTNPNGSRVGTQGDEVYFSTSGSFQHCVNTSATTATSPTGTTWRCSSAYTTP